MAIAKSRYPELRAWMERTETTQEALGRLLGVKQAQISRYISGSRNLPLEHVRKLALLTDIPVEKLLRSEDAARIKKLLGISPETVSGKSKDQANVA